MRHDLFGNDFLFTKKRGNFRCAFSPDWTTRLLFRQLQSNLIGFRFHFHQINPFKLYWKTSRDDLVGKMSYICTEKNTSNNRYD